MRNEIDRAWSHGASRRSALRHLAGFLAASPLLPGQQESEQDPFRDHSRVPGIRELVTALDFEPVAYAKLRRYDYDYTAYGTDSEFTLRRNREAFGWAELVPDRAGNPAPIDTSTEVFGTKMAFPILVSPTAGHVALHPEGEIATYRGAAAAAQTPFIVSNNTSIPFEKIAAAAKGPLWAQIYPKQMPEDNREYLERVQAAGAKAIVVTMDQQAARYERSLHDQNLAARPAAARPAVSRNPYRLSEFRLWYTWQYFDMIRPMVKTPLLAKGVNTAEDARLCLEHGVDGIYVSNHGGRSLDYGPSTLEIMPEIVDAVGGRVPIIFDSGVRRGSDALKALALGAKAVCLGRVPRWGLAAYGAPGVERILEIMQAELVDAMAYTGCASIASAGKSIIRTDFP